MLSVEQCLAAMKECDTPVVRFAVGATGVSGDCAADAGDSGAREASFFVHGWNSDPAAVAHDSAYTNFFGNVKLDGTEAAHDGERTGPDYLQKPWTA